MRAWMRVPEAALATKFSTEVPEAALATKFSTDGSIDMKTAVILVGTPVLDLIKIKIGQRKTVKTLEGQRSRVTGKHWKHSLRDSVRSAACCSSFEYLLTHIVPPYYLTHSSVGQKLCDARGPVLKRRKKMRRRPSKDRSRTWSRKV